MRGRRTGGETWPGTAAVDRLAKSTTNLFRLKIVNILYRENDWVYVIGLDTRQEGFIPYSYCSPYNSHLAELAIKKKLPRETQLPSGESSDTNHECDLAGLDTSDCDSLGKKQVRGAGSPISIRSEPDMLPFSKDPSGRYIVLYTFIARDENDVSVERGEFVTGKSTPTVSSNSEKYTLSVVPFFKSRLFN
jgi:hypothetical protein